MTCEGSRVEEPKLFNIGSWSFPGGHGGEFSLWIWFGWSRGQDTASRCRTQRMWDIYHNPTATTTTTMLPSKTTTTMTTTTATAAAAATSRLPCNPLTGLGGPALWGLERSALRALARGVFGPRCRAKLGVKNIPVSFVLSHGSCPRIFLLSP